MTAAMRGWLLGAVGAIGVGVFLLMQLLRGKRPAREATAPTRPMHDAAMDRELEAVTAADTELEERREELEAAIDEDDPDTRSAEISDLLNRRGSF